MIVGAGLAGLIAAHAFPKETILEAMPRPAALHQALLRFRSDRVSEITGIEFQKVKVRKGIWNGDSFEQPTIANANQYSLKVLGKVLDRSIWNLDTAVRYIAPYTFYEQLVETFESRIQWGEKANFTEAEDVIISTAPMDITLQSLGSAHELTFHEGAPEFKHAPIQVLRFSIPSASVNQTIYYPRAAHSMYRASITNDLMICEFRGNARGPWIGDLRKSFGGIPMDVDAISNDAVEQRYGKIAPIDETFRQTAIRQLTERHNIYSLGRFATWRNILLDDIVQDTSIIKKLISASAYERRLASSRQQR